MRSERREKFLGNEKKLLAELKLPELLTASGMVSILNTMMGRQEFFKLAEKINSREEHS